MTTSEKVAYLKGLVEGLGIDETTKEGKILSNILDILEDLALDVEDMNGNLAELEEGLDAVSEDLEDLEDVVYDEFDEDEDDEDEENPVFYEVECPSCGESVTFDEGILQSGGLECPKCGEFLEFETDEDAEEENG